MKKIISFTAVLLMLSLVMVDSPEAFAGGGPAAPAPIRRTVPAPKKTTPAQPATPSVPSAAPVSNPASAPAATVPMGYPGYSGYPGAGYPYSNIGSYNYGNCNGCGSFSAGCCQSYGCNRGTTVVIDCGNNRSSCSGNFGCCGGRSLVTRLLNQGNITGARAVLRSINRSLYFGGCAGAC